MATPISLDEFDTEIPEGGVEIAFRGQTFKVRKRTVVDTIEAIQANRARGEAQEGDSTTTEVDSPDALKELFAPYIDGRQLDKFIRTITTPQGGKAALSWRETTALFRRISEISNGVLDEGEGEAPKGESS